MTVINLSKSSDRKIEIAGDSESDEIFLAEVFFSARFEEFASLGWSDEQLREFLLMQFNFQTQSYRVQFPDAENLIIYLDNEKIGRLIVNRSPTDLRLVDISLLPEFRNSGIGTKIIKDLLIEAEGKNLPLNLQVARNNSSAFRLYLKLGFRIICEDEMHLSMEWRKIQN